MNLRTQMAMAGASRHRNKAKGFKRNSLNRHHGHKGHKGPRNHDALKKVLATTQKKKTASSIAMNVLRKATRIRPAVKQDGVSDSKVEKVDYPEESSLDSKFVSRFITMDPKNPKKLVWDIFLAVLILVSVVIILFRIGFDIDSTGFGKVIDYIVDILFGVDMILNFFVGYEDPELEIVVTNKAVIASNYLRSWFIIDFLSTVPIDSIATSFLVRGNDVEQFLRHTNETNLDVTFVPNNLLARCKKR